MAEHKHSCGCGCESHENEHCGCGAEHTAAPAAEKIDIISAGDSKAHVYILENLGCANCAAKMEVKIRQLDGVEAAEISFATRQLRLKADAPARLLPEIRRICRSIESQVEVRERRQEAEPPAAEEPRSFWQKHGELVQILAGAALFVLGEVLELTGAPLALLLPVTIAAYLILGWEVLLTAGRNLLKGHVFDENFLMSIATLGAFVIQEFPEAVGVMLFYRIGEYFEERAVEKSRRQILEAIDLRPETVNLLDGRAVTVIPAREARVGDRLLVRPGDRVPLDGVVISGESRIDTSPITGEPVPVSVEPGSAVVSGCVNLSGLLMIRVEKPLAESMVTKILDSVENAAASKPKIDRFITRFARVYTPVVVLVALLTAVLPPLLFHGSWQHWIYTALTFLVMSCPCALVLSVPLAFFSGIGAGSRRGILFKGGASIEALARVKAVVLDKTGTLTQGDFALRLVEPAEGWTEESLLAVCAACESASTHPVGISIVAAAKDRGIYADRAAEVEEIAGHGVRAMVAGRLVLCGNRRLLERFGVDVPKLADTAMGSEVLCAVDGRYAGRLTVADEVKPGAAAAVAELKRSGAAVVMLTGDTEQSAAAVARTVGIEDVRARLLPHEKVEAMQQLRQQYGPVLFVGDGINDAPVLAGADVGAAMGSGADAAIEAADVVFLRSEAEAVPHSMTLARLANRVSLQNVVFALAVKLIVMVLGLFGFASMWAAVFADSGVAMLCVLNSVRVLYRK